MPEHLQIGTLRDATARPFVDAWLGWRGSALVPRRRQMDLRQIVQALPMVVLFELRGPDDVRIRLAGTGIDLYFGRGITGMNYADLTPAPQWPARRHRLQSMALHPCGGALLHEVIVLAVPVIITTITLPLLPDEPDGPPMLFSYVVLPDGLLWSETAPLAETIRLPDAFSFVDIGAGVPASTEPG